MINIEDPGKGVRSHIELRCSTCEGGFSVFGDAARLLSRYMIQREVVPTCKICNDLLDITFRLYGNLYGKL